MYWTNVETSDRNKLYYVKVVNYFKIGRKNVVLQIVFVYYKDLHSEVRDMYYPVKCKTLNC